MIRKYRADIEQFNYKETLCEDRTPILRINIKGIELKCDKSIAEPVLDRFGEDIFIKNETEKDFSFATKAVLSDALVTWIINYSDKIEVKKPENLKEMIKERARLVLKIYE